MLDYIREVYQILDEKVSRDHDLEFIYDKLAYSAKSSKAYMISNKMVGRRIFTTKFAQIIGEMESWPNQKVQLI